MNVFRIQICKDNLERVYECDLMVVEGGLPKTAKTVLSIILDKRLVRSAWMSECLNTKQLEDPQKFEIVINNAKIAGIGSCRHSFIV